METNAKLPSILLNATEARPEAAATILQGRTPPVTSVALDLAEDRDLARPGRHRTWPFVVPPAAPSSPLRLRSNTLPSPEAAPAMAPAGEGRRPQIQFAHLQDAPTPPVPGEAVRRPAEPAGHPSGRLRLETVFKSPLLTSPSSSAGTTPVRSRSLDGLERGLPSPFLPGYFASLPSTAPTSITSRRSSVSSLPCADACAPCQQTEAQRLALAQAQAQIQALTFALAQVQAGALPQAAEAPPSPLPTATAPQATAPSAPRQQAAFPLPQLASDVASSGRLADLRLLRHLPAPLARTAQISCRGHLQALWRGCPVAADGPPKAAGMRAKIRFCLAQIVKAIVSLALNLLDAAVYVLTWLHNAGVFNTLSALLNAHTLYRLAQALA